MFGPNLDGTRGNTVRQNPYRVVMDYVAVPKCFIKLHKFITLVENVMFVNGALLLITMSRGKQFVTAEYILTCTAKQLSKYLK